LAGRGKICIDDDEGASADLRKCPQQQSRRDLFSREKNNVVLFGVRVRVRVRAGVNPNLNP